MKKFKKIFVSGLVATMVIVFAAVGLATAEDTITGTVAEQGDGFLELSMIVPALTLCSPLMTAPIFSKAATWRPKWSVKK